MNKVALLITILMISFGFYWFEWRPTEIRKSCALAAADFPYDSQENFYKNCVLQNGIES